MSFDPSKLDLEGFKSAIDLSKQLITLSTGILAISITFIKDIVKDNKAVAGWVLWISWGLYFLSIFLGIGSVMALTGALFQYRCNPEIVQCREDFSAVIASGGKIPLYPENVETFSQLQICTFLLATIILIIFGIKTLRNMVKINNEPKIESV